jgi:cardiolipin synthase
VASHLFGAAAAFFAIRDSRTPQGAVGWVLFLIMLPYVALPVFLFLGHTRFPGYVLARRSSKEVISGLADFGARYPSNLVRLDPTVRTHLEGFQRLAEMPILSGNSATLLVDGEETFETIFSAIAQATSYVLVQFYIFRDDEIGRALKDRLIRKASEGCRIRLLFDAIGSYALPESYLNDLRAAGVTCRDFHSIRRTNSRFQVNFRNHRKIVIVDGEVGFLGGFNVGDEYMGRSPRFGHWRDTHVRLEGPIVAQLQLIFVEDWNWATEERPQLNWQPSEAAGGLDALILAPGPADTLETGSLYFCNAINAAQRRIWIASPYCVPDTDVLSALAVAAVRGVDVRVLVTGKRDHWFVWLAAFAYFDEMRQAGIKVFRYVDGFMHQKVVLVDETFASIGTVNLDNRSCRLNFEATALVFDAGFAKEVEAMLEADFSHSKAHTMCLEDSPSRVRRYGAPVARLLAPLL